MIESVLTFKKRRDEEELMDLPSTSRQDFIRALQDIQWVNRNLGGIQAIQSKLERMLPIGFRGNVSILDLGTGSADIPLALAKWAQNNQRIPLTITAVDLHPVAVETARNMIRGYPEIKVCQGDALNWPMPDQSYDYVISSMFMHHLPQDEAVRLLREMARLCKYGLIVNDLERHPMAWLGIKLLSILTGKGRIFRNDAPLSVLRGFTKTELEALKQEVGLPQLQIQRQYPYRWIVSWQRPDGERQA